jgi:serine/threonine protein kinase
MKIQIHPSYQSLTPFIKLLPDRFDTDGEIIFKERNTLKKIRTDGQTLIVKLFKTPHIINRIAYTFFRLSKAERSYKYALELIEKGITTPFPIAYITEKKGGLFSRSFYVSSYIDYSGLLRELAYHPLEEVKALAEAFAHFTAFLHDNEVFHIDYSPGNILYKKEEDQYRFCLVDLNRMKFEKVDINAGCFNLRRLWGEERTIAYIAAVYAKDRGFNEKECVDLSLRYHAAFWKKQTKKHPDQKAYRGNS